MNSTQHMKHSDLISLAQEGLLHEADTLASLASAPHFITLVEHLEDYPGFLASGRYQLLGESFPAELMVDHSIDFGKSDVEVIKLKHADQPVGCLRSFCRLVAVS